MFFTINKTTVQASTVTPDEIISSLSLATYAGQTSEPVSCRLASEDEYGETVTLTCPDPNIEISSNQRLGYGDSVTIEVEAGAVSDTVYIRAIADLDATEGDNQATIFCDNGSSLLLNYYFASTDEGSTETPPVVRFLGQETINLAEQFELYGEAVRLRQYEPQPNPSRDSLDNPFPLQSLHNLAPEELCNPFNQTVGYTSEDYYSKAFVGDRNLDINTVFDNDTQLVFTDTERIVLPPDFLGFDPSHITTEEYYGQIGPSQPSYQRTQWTLLRHDGEYALTNIQQQKYYNGQFLFYVADLIRIVYPQGYQDGFLPWNQLYSLDEEGGQVVGYVPGFSKIAVDTEDPYMEDPYVEDPYLEDPYIDDDGPEEHGGDEPI